MDQYGFGYWNIPRRGIAVYDYIHEKQIEKAGEVKAMQALFLGT